MLIIFHSIPFSTPGKTIRLKELYTEAMPRPTGITADHVFFCSYKSALEKLNAGKVLEASVIAGYGRVGSSAAMLEICYSEYVEAYYEETGVELEPKDDYDGKVNVFYTNFPG